MREDEWEQARIADEILDMYNQSIKPKMVTWCDIGEKYLASYCVSYTKYFEDSGYVLVIKDHGVLIQKTEPILIFEEYLVEAWKILAPKDKLPTANRILNCPSVQRMLLGK